MTVLRCVKVKANEVAKCHNHNLRKYTNQNQTNINFNRQQNQICLGSEDTHGTLKNRLEKIENRRAIRKDANVMLEFIFSASPEYFYKDLDREKFDKLTMEKNKPELDKIFNEQLDKQKLEDFKAVVIEYCQKEFGDNVINLTLHLDEKTPHFHLLCTPITADNRLTAKEFFTPITARAWQDSFGEACKKLGIDRGRENSPEVHTSHHDHNRALNTPVPTPPTVKTPQTPTEEEIFKDGLFGKKQLIKTEDLLKQFREREKAVNEKYKFYKKYYNENKEKIAELEETKTENEKLKKENFIMKEKQQKLDSETMENLRQIPVKTVLENLGYELKKTDAQRYQLAQGEKLVITPSTNQFFNNTTGKKGFGAISLLVDGLGFSFKEAKEILLSNFDSKAIAKEIIENKTTALKTIEKTLDTEKIELPQPRQSNLNNIEKYLTEERGLDKTLIQPLIEKGVIYADSRNNVIFTNEQKTFCSMRGTIKDSKFKGIKGNGELIAYDFTNGEENKNLYVFESPIDALSYRQINPTHNGTYLITCGNYGISKVHETADKHQKVFVCTDNDQAGNEFFNKITEQTTAKTEQVKPHKKDFNEDLKAINTAKNLYKEIENLQNKQRPTQNQQQKAKDYIENELEQQRRKFRPR